MYCCPKGNIEDAALTLITRSRVPFFDPAALLEVYNKEPLEHAIVQVTIDQLGLLARYGSQLAPFDLTLVTNVPGIVYRADWMMLAAALPRVDWMELEGRLAKSGLTGYTPDQKAAATPRIAHTPLAVDPDTGGTDDDDFVTSPGDGTL